MRLRRLQHPLVTLFLLGCLAGVWYWVRTPDPRYEYVLVCGGGSTPLLRPVDLPNVLVVRRVGDVWAIENPNDTSWDLATRILAGDEPHAAVVSYDQRYEWRSGTFALTEHHVNEVVRIDGAKVTDGERPAIRAAYLHAIGMTSWGAAVEERLRQGDRVFVEPIWLGYFQTLLFVCLVLAEIFSLVWVIRVPKWIRARRAAGRVARGLCPVCGYEVGAHVPRCPECSAQLPLSSESGDLGAKKEGAASSAAP